MTSLAGRPYVRSVKWMHDSQLMASATAYFTRLASSKTTTKLSILKNAKFRSPHTFVSAQSTYCYRCEQRMRTEAMYQPIDKRPVVFRLSVGKDCDSQLANFATKQKTIPLKSGKSLECKYIDNTATIVSGF
jgi:hypothetical protein